MGAEIPNEISGTSKSVPKGFWCQIDRNRIPLNWGVQSVETMIPNDTFVIEL